MDNSNITDTARAMEVEALLAIYEEDLKIVQDKDDENAISFEIELVDIDAVLNITLSDEYPKRAPAISVQKGGKHLVDLEELLKMASKSLCGEVMVHSLIEEANNWARENKSRDKCYSMKAEDEKVASPVCKFFLEGRCRFGDRCLNIHQLAGKEVDTEQNTECSDKEQNMENAGKENESNKITKQSVNPGNIKENKEGRKTKKAPMKTATDVISRILWDDKIDPKHFTVGYLDRFIGIIERDFSDFSWEDIASVDYDVLSIPKHRIQYFKYHGEIVWDKRERIDKIFGSTGSGCTILEIMGNENRQEEREEESEVLMDKNEQIEEEDVLCGKMVTTLRNNNGPNHFIAFKVQDVGILEKVDKLHKELILREKSMSEGIIPPQNLHLTLLVLTIKNDDQLDLVKDILKGTHHIIPSTLPLSRKLKFKGIGSFNDRILYVKAEKEPNLEKFVQILKSRLHKAGINMNGNRDIFEPHVTVVRSPPSCKTSRAACREVFSTFESAYQDCEFGAQSISEVGLFSRFDPKDSDGFHRQVLTMKNSLLSVSPSLEKKVLKYVVDLYDADKISIDLKQKITTAFASQEAVKIDGALSLIDISVPKDPTKLVVILRGLPGSGKTCLVENSLEYGENPGLTVCSPKQLFYRAGNSKMDQSELNIAEAYCRNGFLEALNSGALMVVVDDCHSQRWQYAFYRKVAPLFGYFLRILEISASDRDAILECHKHGESGSSVEDLMEMVHEWEEDPEALHIKPWFRNPALREKGGLVLKKLFESAQ